MRSINKAILVGLILVCLGVSAQRGYDYYKENFRVAKEGECLKLSHGSKEYKVQILLNNDELKASFVIVESSPGSGDGYINVFKYKYMRDMHAKKVECDEKTE